MPNKLNEQQKQAVEYNDGPLIIIAGAGTGKTTVITEKIKYLIEEKDALPEEVLALTFTEKAAQEMEDRVCDNLNLGYANIQISTFHSFCQVILEKHGLDIGLSNSFNLLSQTDAWLLIRDNFDKFDLDYYAPMGNPTSYIHELIKHFSKCKDELVGPDKYLEYAENLKLDNDDTQGEIKNKYEEVAKAYHVYNQILLDNACLDFGDLIFYMIKILKERPEILKSLQKQFKYILVDEFQDVNWAQYILVKLLSDKGSKLTVVGDDDQSIYAFRGASVSNILRFKEDYPGTEEIVLNYNYRSGQKILDLAYKSIQNNNPDRLEEKLKIDKKLKSKTDLKSEIIQIHTGSVGEEAKIVVEEIEKIKKDDSDATWDDFAILVRANSHADIFLDELNSKKIPYEFLAATGLYKQPIVIDCVNYFKTLDNYRESSAVFRLLNLPFINLDSDDLQKITYFSKRKAISYYETLKQATQFGLSIEGINKVTKILSLIDEGTKKVRFEKPTVVLYNFLEKSGYLDYLTKEENAGNRNVIRQIFQLREFFNYIKNFEVLKSESRVYNFLEHYKYIIESGDGGVPYKPADTSDSVNVMTMHSAKGLEYKYVFLVNLVEDRFPSRRKGGEIELPEELINEVLPSGDHHIQEERRLFYVGITRAKTKLFLISADNYGGVRKKKISRFLDELDYKAQTNSTTQVDLVRVPKEQKSEPGDFVYKIPSKFSFSQINSYKRCPYQYKLAHILKLPGQGSASFSFGQTMHNTLQKFYEKVQELNAVKQGAFFPVVKEGVVESLEKNNIKVPALEELLKIYEKNWIDDWYKTKKQKDNYYKKGKEILKTFYEVQEKWTIPIALESGFKIKIGENAIGGRIDRIDKLEDGTLEIIDYKTGKSKEKLSPDDKDQLLIYQVALEELPEYQNQGIPSKLTFYYLNDSLQNSFLGKEKEKEKLKEKIENIIQKIKDQNFKATPNKIICKNCDFKDICEYRKL